MPVGRGRDESLHPRVSRRIGPMMGQDEKGTDGRGRRSVTIRDVAALAAVSIGTASRVINGHPNVAPDIRDRVKQAIAELKYEPNVFAQSMRSRSSRTVGVMVPSITVPSLASFVRAAQD